MQIYIIRHGETDWNVERMLQGKKGADLNDKGVKLAEITRDALVDTHFDICFTSPALRARHTAEIILEGRDIEIIDDERLIEISFGWWEGKHSMGPNAEIPQDEFQMFFKDSYNYIPPEGGETIQEMIDRSEDFLQEIMSKSEYQDKSILISSHGCATRALLNGIYEDNSDFWHGCVPPNCALNVVEVKDGKAKLVEEDVIYWGDQFEVEAYIK